MFCLWSWYFLSSEKNIESINLKPRHIHSHAPTTNNNCPKIILSSSWLYAKCHKIKKVLLTSPSAKYLFQTRHLSQNQIVGLSYEELSQLEALSIKILKWEWCEYFRKTRLKAPSWVLLPSPLIGLLVLLFYPLVLTSQPWSLPSFHFNLTHIFSH